MSAAYGLLFFVMFAFVYFGIIVAVAWALVWLLTPVAYNRWKQLKARDEEQSATDH